MFNHKAYGSCVMMTALGGSFQTLCHRFPKVALGCADGRFK